VNHGKLQGVKILGAVKMVNGTLYGIGVVPVYPELITLKAAKILERVAVVFAAAAASLVLAKGKESFTVISGALGAGNLKKVIDGTQNVVMLKVHKNYSEKLDILNGLDLTASSVLVFLCGLDGEK